MKGNTLFNFMLSNQFAPTNQFIFFALYLFINGKSEK